MLLTKFPKILENIAFEFITSHNRFLTMSLSSVLAVYFSIMNLEQSVKDLQAQNAEFQALILNLSKGQDDLKSLLTKKEKKTKKPKGVLNLGRRFKGPLKKVEEAEIPKDEEEEDDDVSVKTNARSNIGSANQDDNEEDYFHEEEYANEK